jgi:AraC family transcriptional regulator of adaptative response / DNA-3-methyladenine glycosylase II
MELPDDFQHELTLQSLARDPNSPTERCDGWRVARALKLDARPAVLELELAPRQLRCRVDADRVISPIGMAEAHMAARRLLGLDLDPTAFERRVQRSRQLRGLIAGRRGLRVPLLPNVFEALVWSILGQQVNLAFAGACRERLVELAATPLVGGLRLHPEAAAVASLSKRDLVGAKLSARKAEYLIDTAQAVASGRLDLESMGDRSAVAVERELLAVRGLGPWSVNYVMMRGLGLGDCLPLGDSGLAAALQAFFGLRQRPDAAQTLELMAPFAPFRSLACVHLWKSLGDPP